jgi:hypothetical protein
MKGITAALTKGAKIVKEHKEDISSAVKKGTELAEKGSELAEKHQGEISSLSNMAQNHLDNSATNGESIPLGDLTKGLSQSSLGNFTKGLPASFNPQQALGSLKSAADSAKQIVTPQSNNNVDTMAASIASGEKLVDLLKRDLDNTNLGIKPNRYGGPAGPKFYDIIGDDLKNLLMENEQKNFKEINNVLVNYIINEGINFAKADEYILKKFVGSLLKNNEKLFKDILTETIQETLSGKENGKAILEIFKKKLCSDLTLVKHIKPKQLGGTEPLPLTKEEREKIFALFAIYLRPHYVGLLTNQKVLNEAILPGIKQSLRTKEGERKIQEVLIPKMVEFINLNFKDLINNHNDDIIKQILLMVLNSTCTYNRELGENRIKVSPAIEEAFINAIENSMNAARSDENSVNLSPALFADNIFKNIVNDLMYQSIKMEGGKAKKTQKKHKKTVKKNRKTNRKSKNLKPKN